MPEDEQQPKENILWARIDDETEGMLQEVMRDEGGISRPDAARKLLPLGFHTWKQDREWLKERRRQQAEAV